MKELELQYKLQAQREIDLANYELDKGLINEKEFEKIKWEVMLFAKKEIEYLLNK